MTKSFGGDGVGGNNGQSGDDEEQEQVPLWRPCFYGLAVAVLLSWSLWSWSNGDLARADAGQQTDNGHRDGMAVHDAFELFVHGRVLRSMTVMDTTRNGHDRSQRWWHSLDKSFLLQNGSRGDGDDGHQIQVDSCMVVVDVVVVLGL